METRVEHYWGKQLTFRQMEDQPVVVLEDGDNAVVLVERIEPDAENTFDTGMQDALYLEIKGTPPVGETVDARLALRAAVYQFGGIVLLYQSNSFDGTLHIRQWEPGVRIAGSCDLRFDFPMVDVTGAGELELEREFEASRAEGDARLGRRQRWICATCAAINVGELQACLHCGAPAPSAPGPPLERPQPNPRG